MSVVGCFIGVLLGMSGALRAKVRGTECASQPVFRMMETPVRILLIALIAALALVGCGRSSDAAKASGKSRLYDTQRGALEKARGVNDTLRQADQARRAQEESQTQ